MSARVPKLIATLLFASLFAMAQTRPITNPNKGHSNSRASKAGSTSSSAPDKALMRKIWDAWNTLDPANAAPFYDKGAERVFFDITPLKYAGWQAYATGAKDVLAGFQSLNATVSDDAQVHTQGRLAWGTATWHADTVMKDGSSSPLDGRWTVVWEKRGDKWLIIHEHVSVPLAAPEKK